VGYWPFWAGGIALTIVALAHQFLFGRHLGVSGKLTALVNRATSRNSSATEMDEAAMLEALRAMTAEEFGDESVGDVTAPAAEASAVEPNEPSFFVGVVLGAAAVALATNRFVPTMTLHGAGFDRFIGTGALALVPLLVGGVLVGFGTRMAGGCTSGHGLVGVSRLQPGSIVATACFFGAGIAISLLLEALR